MSETPLFITNGNYRLYAMLHTPDDGATQAPLRGYGAVLCHPFAEEKLIAHRAMVNLARSLTAHGATCLRFDEMGHGDSDGSFEDSTVESRLSDIRCVLEHMRKHSSVNRIGLIGLRFGATVATLACADGRDIDFLILLSPIVDGRQYIEQCLRSNLTTQMTTYGRILKERKDLIEDLRSGKSVNIDGYLVSSTLYQQMEKVNLLDHCADLPTGTLIVNITGQGVQAPDRGIEKLVAKSGDSKKPVELIAVKDAQCWKELKTYYPAFVDTQKMITDWLSVHSPH